MCVYFSEKYIHFRLYTIVLAKYFVSGQTYYLQMILGIRRFHWSKHECLRVSDWLFAYATFALGYWGSGIYRKTRHCQPNIRASVGYLLATACHPGHWDPRVIRKAVFWSCKIYIQISDGKLLKFESFVMMDHGAARQRSALRGTEPKVKFFLWNFFEKFPSHSSSWKISRIVGKDERNNKIWSKPLEFFKRYHPKQNNN